MSERWFRRLLRLFPREFRDKHGPSMEQVFRDQMREAPSKTAQRTLWARTLGDACRTAPREHVRILGHDTTLALRAMRNSVAMTTIVLLTLALGIGANVTIFSVVNAILLRPLPFEDGDRLMRVYATRDGGPPFLSPSNPVLYDEIVDGGQFYESIVAQRFTDVTLGTDTGPERIAAMAVERAWLKVLGVELAYGRPFTDEEETTGLAADVALISHGFWLRRLGGDTSAIGRSTILIEGRPVTIVGVLPRGFQYPYENQIWIPMNLDRDRDGLWGLNIQARLRDDVSIEEARSELAVTSQRIQETDPALLNGLTLTVIPTREVLLGEDSGFILVLLGAVGFLLLLVAVNIGNLLLARAVTRQSETALRTALGASRLRQLRQVFTESVTLSLCGGALGFALAFWLRSFTPSLIPGRMTNLLEGVSMDMNVVWFTLAVSILTGVLFGLAPAIRATGTELVDVLKQGKTHGSKGTPVCDSRHRRNRARVDDSRRRRHALEPLPGPLPRRPRIRPGAHHARERAARRWRLHLRWGAAHRLRPPNGRTAPNRPRRRRRRRGSVVSVHPWQPSDRSQRRRAPSRSRKTDHIQPPPRHAGLFRRDRDGPRPRSRPRGR